MVYIMKIYVDGGCRNNGRPGAVAAAAAVVKRRWGKRKEFRRCLLREPYPPTNQRAEITAIILALEVGLKRYGELHSSPYMKVTIYSDSKYVIGCMTEWIPKWRRNGWRNAAGNPVANQDLIKEAAELHNKLDKEGRVKYTWIPRDANEHADRLCNLAMDEMIDQEIALEKQKRLAELNRQSGELATVDLALGALAISRSDSAIDMYNSDSYNIAFEQHQKRLGIHAGAW